MLKRIDLVAKLPLCLNEKSKERFDVAFSGFGKQSQFCSYHYRKFNEALVLFHKSYNGEKLEEETEFYRIEFEASAYAFFRALHALVESLPYFLNILLGFEKNLELTKINWKLIENKTTFENKKLINDFRELESYKELEHLVNVSKHRRIPRIDSGVYSDSKLIRFWNEDLDLEFRNYEIIYLMETLFLELQDGALNLINDISKNI
jgi:hypothetical protein